MVSPYYVVPVNYRINLILFYFFRSRDSRGPERREATIVVAMVSSVVGFAGLGQQVARCGVAADGALGALVPRDGEGSELGKEDQPTVGQTAVKPPDQRTPVGTFGIAVGKLGHDGKNRTRHRFSNVLTERGLRTLLTKSRQMGAIRQETSVPSAADARYGRSPQPTLLAWRRPRPACRRSGGGRTACR